MKEKFEMRDKEYFDRCVDYIQSEAITPRKASINTLPFPEGRAGRSSDLAKDSVQLVIMRYSRGDAITEMHASVLQMAELLELKHTTLASVTLEKDVRQMCERLDLGRLYEALALLAFMVALHYPREQLMHTLNLIGHPGEDAFLDHVTHALGDTTRKIAPHSKFPKVYDALVEVVTAPVEQRANLLKKYVEGWYKRMKPIYWHNSDKGGEGAYFGYWCFEGGLVALLFAVDDTSLATHPHYPVDLVAHFRGQSRMFDQSD